MIVAIGALVGVVIVRKLSPLTGHLVAGPPPNPFAHLFRTATNPRYLTGFAAVMLVATGGFMMMPFSSAFAVYNLGIPLERLPELYMASGIVGLIGGPLLGRAADVFGKFKMFAAASVVGAIWTLWYTRLGITPLWIVVAGDCAFAVVLGGRMASTSPLISAVPGPADRGAYMSVSASMQQLAGGVAAWVAGQIVVQKEGAPLERFVLLGYIVIGAMAVSLALIRSGPAAAPAEGRCRPAPPPQE